jgi:alpha-galactosidase
MKQAIRFAGAVLCFSLAAVSMAAAQVQYNEGPVERVVLIHILPGHFSAFMEDLKKNIVPIWEAERPPG